MIHFGTGGWRAVIGDDFTRANVRLLAQGLANRILAETSPGARPGRVVIGYDRRFLSDTAAWWATEVLAGNGVPVTVIDRPTPTPTTMWTVGNLGAAYGMAVTASHNPALYNGIKVFLPGGRDADLEFTESLTQQVNALGEEDVKALEPHEVRGSELVTIFLFIFVATWNNFLLPLMMVTNNVALKPVTLGLYGMMSYFDPTYGAVLQGALLGVLPLVILFLILQRYWKAGLTAGAVDAGGVPGPAGG